MPYGFDYHTYHFQGLKYVSLYDNSLSTHKKWGICCYLWYENDEKMTMNFTTLLLYKRWVSDAKKNM